VAFVCHAEVERVPKGGKEF